MRFPRRISPNVWTAFLLLLVGLKLSIGAAELTIQPKRGFHSAPFEVTFAGVSLGERIFYTTNGSPPAAATGRLYEHPISIHTTTVLCAAQFLPDGKPVGFPSCTTYLFPQDVLRQNGAGFLPTWGFNDGKPVPADYEMDPKIVRAPEYAAVLVPGLKSLPSVCVTAQVGDLFDPKRGIYANPRESGSAWERPASVELFSPDGVEEFQINCGVRIQGGWNRRPEECPKHSLRLVFKKKYGAAALKFPLFGETTPTEFETLILRGGCNNTWLHWSGEERRRGDYLRDQWLRDTQLAMGWLAARGRFVHLYLNGLYWGLYNLCERPGPAFAAAHFGGTSEDYDSRNGDHLLSGNGESFKQLMSRANRGLTNAVDFQAIAETLDLPNFIDYMIANFYGANADWDRSSNWYAARRRIAGGKFHFFVWDGERTLEAVDGNSMEFDDDESPARLFQKLRVNEEFRLMFADRVQTHLFDQGALTPAVAAARYRRRADEIGTAIIAESARWGDYRRDVHPYKTGPYELYTVNGHWRPEITRLLNDYFPKRTAMVLEQFRAVGLYPRVAAPLIRLSARHCELQTKEGKVFFTTDGSDPRLPGGGLAAGAALYKKPVELRTGAIMKARAFVGEAAAGEWSALVEQSAF